MTDLWRRTAAQAPRPRRPAAAETLFIEAAAGRQLADRRREESVGRAGAIRAPDPRLATPQERIVHALYMLSSHRTNARSAPTVNPDLAALRGPEFRRPRDTVALTALDGPSAGHNGGARERNPGSGERRPADADQPRHSWGMLGVFSTGEMFHAEYGSHPCYCGALILRIVEQACPRPLK